MPRITNYPETTEPKDSNYYIVQTTNGTAKIKHQTLIQILIGGNQNGSN